MEASEIDLSSLADLVAERVAKIMMTRDGEPKITPRLLNVEQTASYIGRTEDAVQKLITNGTLPVSQLDSRRFVDRVKLDKMIEDKTFFR